MNLDDDGQIAFVLLCVAALVVLYHHRKRWRGSGSAHGTARWADAQDLRRAGMLSGGGLILGRMPTRAGRLIRIPAYTHLMAVAPTGAGKGVSLVLPNLMSYARGSCFVWDPKGENYHLSAATRRALGQSVVLLDPFGVTGGGGEGFNPLCLIREGPRLVDEAKALAEAIVVRTGKEQDLHWVESAVAVIHGMLVYVLLRFREEERHLGSVCDLVADSGLFAAAAEQLRGMGGIPGRLGSYLSGLRDKELSSVISTANRQLACFGSELVMGMLSGGSFDATDILRPRPGTTVYFVLPQDQLQAQRGTLRLVVASLLRLVLRHGVERGGEVLFLLDECASLGRLDELEQALVLGRGSGIRLFTFWQSADQARVAFEDKPGLFFDNSATQIYFGAASYETAERVSKMLGDATMVVEGYSENEGRSWQGGSNAGGGSQISRGSGRNFSEIGRALLRPEEVLALSGAYLLAFLRDVPPVLARRVKWYEERFDARGPGCPGSSWSWWLALAAALALAAWAASRP